MAILLDFEKAREDSREVEYAFGYSGDLDRRMVVEKASRQVSVLDDNPDKDSTRVFVKITGFYERQGRWPEQGSYAA